MNTTFDFGGVITRAWEIIWKHKVLWIFGILAGCASGGGSNGAGSSYSFSNQDMQQGDFGPLEDFLSGVNEGMVMTFVLVMIAVVLVIILLALLLNTVGRVGLVKGTLEVQGGAPILVFSELFQSSLRYFWRVLGLNLLIGLSITVIAAALFIPMAILTGLTMGLFALCLIPLICLMIPVMWAVSVLVEQINIILIVEDLGILEAMRRGWAFFRQHWGTVLLMGLILGLIGMVAGGVISLPLFFTMFPLLTGLLLAGGDGALGGMIVAGICLAAYLPVLLVLSGILNAFTHSAWTLTYLRLTRPAAPAGGFTPQPPAMAQPPTAEVF